MKASALVVFGSLLTVSLLARIDPAKVKAGQVPAPGSPAAVPPERSEDEKLIRAMITDFVKAFDNGDAKSIVAMFTPQGEAIDTEGNAIRGRDALEVHYTERFAGAPGEKLEASIELLHFLAPEVVRQDGRTKLIPAGNGLASTSRYTATFVKTQGRWLIASIRDLEDTSLTHHDRLKELEWLVGDWVEESGGIVITTKVAWSEDKNFLLRSYDIKIDGKTDHEGTQRIGWDPLTRQIKSWVFDSEGGYGDGFWARSGDSWAIKSTGVRPNGQTISATQILTRMSKDRLLWRSTDRTLGGEHQEDTHEIIMVRTPPQPK